MARYSNAFDLLAEEDSDDLMAVVDHVVAKKTAKQEEEEKARRKQEDVRLEEEKARIQQEMAWLEQENGILPQDAQAASSQNGRGGRGRGRGGRGDGPGANGQRGDGRLGDSYGRGNGRGGWGRGVAGEEGRSRGRGGRYYGGRGGDDYQYYDSDNRGYYHGGSNGVPYGGAEDQNQDRGNWGYHNGNGYYGRGGGRGGQYGGRGRGYYRDQGYQNVNQYYDPNNQGQEEGEEQNHEYGNQWTSNEDGYYGGRERRCFRNDAQSFRSGDGEQGQGNSRHAKSHMWIPVTKDGGEKNADASNEQELINNDNSEILEGSGSKDEAEKNPVQGATNQPQATKEAKSEIDEEDDSNKMTLDEYEKILAEKRKALETVKSVARKVDSRGFEGMQLVGKKKEDEEPQKSENEEPSKKGSSEKEDKIRKVNTEELSKLAGGLRLTLPRYRRGWVDGYQGAYRGGAPGNMGNGRGRGEYVANGRGAPGNVHDGSGHGENVVNDRGAGSGNFSSRNPNEEIERGQQRNGRFRGGYPGRSAGYDRTERGNDLHSSKKSQDHVEDDNANGQLPSPAGQVSNERTSGDYPARSASQDPRDNSNGGIRGGYVARPAGRGQYFERSGRGNGGYRIRQGPPPKLEDQKQFPGLG